MNSFLTPVNIKTLMKNNESEEYWCEICQILFSTKSSLFYHVAKNIHRKPKKLEMENINLKKIEKMKTNPKSDLKKFTNPKEVANKNNESQELNKCYICNVEFNQLEFHFLNSHISEDAADDNFSDKTTPETEEEDIAIIIEEKFRENKNCPRPRSSPQYHSLIRGVLIQSCSTEAKNFDKYVFYHVQFSCVIQTIAYHRAIFTLTVYINYYQNNQFYIVKISFSK